MGASNLYKWLLRSPSRNARIAAYTTLALQIPELLEQARARDQNAIFQTAAYVFGAFFTASIGTAFLNVVAPSNSKIRTRLSDFKIIKALENQVDNQAPPSLGFSGEKIITDGFWKAATRAHDEPESIEQHARAEKNISELVHSSIRYLRYEKFDKAMECMRDALDLLNGKKPVLSLKTKFALAPITCMIPIGYRLQPRAVANYMISAIYKSITDPKNAWRYTALGKLAADKLNLDGRTEMYLIHALLATAQRRSDEPEAWKDATTILNQNGTTHRIGESRHPVWELADSPFFTNTLVFKGNPNREALQNEVFSAKALENILGDMAKVPHPLYVTQEPTDGNYIYSMLRLPGKTLDEQIAKEDYSAFEEINSVLARIHAKYQTEELTKIDLAKKTERKLKEMGIEQDLANLILANISPVHEAVEKDAPIAAIKDAHPGNWEILPEAPHIGVLDTEITEKGPVMLDVANLYGFADGMTREQKVQYVMRYVAKLQKEGVHAYYDAPFTTHAFHNAEIQRMGIDLMGAWSAPDRESMHKERPKLAGRAIKAIDSLSTEDKRYQQLKKAFEGVQKALS